VYGSRDYYYPDYYDLEATIEDLLYMGYKKAGELSNSSLDDFVDVFGVNAYMDLADMLMQGEIKEETFIQGITDHKCARSDFGLKPYASYPAYIE
jgi:hypothetical protein